MDSTHRPSTSPTTPTRREVLGWSLAALGLAPLQGPHSPLLKWGSSIQAAASEETGSAKAASALSKKTGSAKAASALTDMGFALLGQLHPGEGDANVFISPLSIATAVAMLYNGARGATATGIAAALRLRGLSPDAVDAAYASFLPALSSGDPKSVRLTVGNALYARGGVPFEQAFLEHVRSSFAAKVATIDFNQPHAGSLINAWVKERTHGLIPTIVPDRLPSDAVMYILNAVYFKGGWTTPFDPAHTRPHAFTPHSGRAIGVEMMARSGSFGYHKGDGYEAVRLPYGKGKFSFYGVLPSAGSSPAVFSTGLSALRWTAIVAALSFSEGTVNLPRFKVDYTASPNLNGALTALGMGDVFDPQRADLSGLTARPRTFVSEVVHKAVMHVDEKGTTAAGVTSIGVGTLAVPSKTFTLTFDRPFFCAIGDDTTGAVLFMGVIGRPG